MLISQDDLENVSSFQQVLGHWIVYATGLFSEFNSQQLLWNSFILSSLLSNHAMSMNIEIGTLNRTVVRHKKISVSSSVVLTFKSVLRLNWKFC